jgi:hypothetical protein
MYCLIVLHLFLHYIMNVENLISSWSIMSKTTLIIQIILFTYGVNLEGKRLDGILYEEVDNNDIPQ